ncbi:MAG: phenylacetate-CoA oxygenase subunit PaaI, partial [Pseudomonadota bacterium]
MAATPSSLSSHADYFLHLADNALILGQRNAEWLGHGPVLEEDIAMANISLDLIGQARLLYQHIAPTLATACAALPPEGANFSRGGPSKNCLSSVTEDTLAYFRDAPEFRNYTLLELPHGLAEGERDYAFTITRN